jgi:hypothetical protein
MLRTLLIKAFFDPNLAHATIALALLPPGHIEKPFELTISPSSGLLST